MINITKIDVFLLRFLQDLLYEVILAHLQATAAAAEQGHAELPRHGARAPALVIDAIESWKSKLKTCSKPISNANLNGILMDF